MTAHRRREQDRKRARRARRRAERERSYAAAVEAMRVAREERLSRLGPLVEMYGEGSELLRMIDRALIEAERRPFISVELVAPTRSEPDPSYATDLWRALAMHFVFKQHATQHRADMAALLPVRQRNDDP